MEQTGIYAQILDYAHRADPYRLYPELRATPVARQEDGSYLVSTYQEIVELLHDPRLAMHRTESPSEEPTFGATFAVLDPPEHDRLRAKVMCRFGPPGSPGLIDGMVPRMLEVVTGLIDSFAGRGRVDIVEDFAYPFPVTMICEVLGVPREDEPLFHEWSEAIIESLDPLAGAPVERRAEASIALRRYLGELVDVHRRRPGDDMLSGLIADGELSLDELLSTGMTLLIAGHETTVNLIANGVLTLLRDPALLERMRREPDLIPRAVEELLRYEPPVQIASLQRIALADIDLAGTTIPKGSIIKLALGAANRDPGRFHDPDRFDPDRKDNQHLGFGGGIHYCFGAPLARLEAQIALGEFTRRVVGPRLVTDPPPYRQNADLRGPRHLLVDFDAVVPGAPST